MVSLPWVPCRTPAATTTAPETLATGLCFLADPDRAHRRGLLLHLCSTGRAHDLQLYLVALWIILDAAVRAGRGRTAVSYKRAVAQQAEQKDTSSAEAVEVEEPQLDLKQVNQQSLRLIRLALVAVVGLLVYWVWADVLHAFAYTDNIVLWETSEGSGQAATSSLISLGDVIAALIIGAVTFLLASNLPGLLEVLVLSRWITQGTSYATTTLLSYVIVASGIVLTLGSLGLSWDKMQWLVAALGLVSASVCRRFLPALSQRHPAV